MRACVRACVRVYENVDIRMLIKLRFGRIGRGAAARCAMTGAGTGTGTGTGTEMGTGTGIGTEAEGSDVKL